MEVYDLSEENELGTHMSGEVPVPEGDEAQSLTQEELGQGQEDHCWFNHEIPYTTSVFDSLTKLFEGKNINQNMTLRKQLKNVNIQNAETIQSYFTRVSQIKEEIEPMDEEL